MPLDVVPVFLGALARILLEREALGADRVDELEFRLRSEVLVEVRFLLASALPGERAYHQLDALGELHDGLAGTLQFRSHRLGEQRILRILVGKPLDRALSERRR